MPLMFCWIIACLMISSVTRQFLLCEEFSFSLLGGCWKGVGVRLVKGTGMREFSQFNGVE